MWSLFTRSAAGSFIARILMSLGIGFMSYLGFTEVLALASEQIHSFVIGFGGGVAGFLGLCNLDHMINAIFSAYSAQLAMTASRKLFMK